MNKPGVYWSRVQVRFLASRTETNPNALQLPPSSLIRAAGVVAKVIDPSGGQNRVTSEDITLASEGIKHGWSVTLPNTGGQWANNFVEPWLNVEVVGTTPAEVMTTIHRLLGRVRGEVTSLEAEAKVAAKNRIQLQDSPATPQIYYQHGNRARAVAAALLLGVGITAAMVTLLRIVFRRMGQRRASVGDEAMPAASGKQELVRSAPGR